MNSVSRLRIWQIDAIGVASCALLALLWYAAGLQPLSQAKADRITKQTELSQREEKVAVLDRVGRDMKKELAAVQEQMKETVKLESADLTTQRQGEIRALAESLHLKVDEVKPGTVVAGNRCTKVPIVLVGSGRATDCARFLHELRIKHKDVGVSAFSLKGQPENPDRPAQFVFNFVWYAAPATGAPAK